MILIKIHFENAEVCLRDRLNTVKLLNKLLLYMLYVMFYVLKPHMINIHVVRKRSNHLKYLFSLQKHPRVYHVYKLAMNNIFLDHVDVQ